MARINIEEAWFSDPRRERLKDLVGGEVETVAVAMWRLAQDHSNERVVPEKLFKMIKHWEAFVKAGLAFKNNGGYYVCGTEERFKWLEVCRKSGKKGGLAKAKGSLAKGKGTLSVCLPSASASVSVSKKEELYSPPSETHIVSVGEEFSNENPSPPSATKREKNNQAPGRAEKLQFDKDEYEQFYVVCTNKGGHDPGLQKWIKTSRRDKDAAMKWAKWERSQIQRGEKSEQFVKRPVKILLDRPWNDESYQPKEDKEQPPPEENPRYQEMLKKRGLT